MKNNNTYRVIGVMSGTSLDGLDVAVCEFNIKKGKWDYKIEEAETFGYTEQLKQRLSKATNLSAFDLNMLEVDLSNFIGQKCRELAPHKEIDFISSHGHTVFHQPDKGLTLQIGDGNIIHAISGLPVVYDFRSLDVARGGQGAPLVPIADKYLFSDYSHCLNLGGIANISFDESNGSRKAFDISPCNMLLNRLAQREGLEFDENGKLAESGKIDQVLLSKWNDYDYYGQSGVKSLGYEWVEQYYFTDLDNENIENTAATAVEHIANQIAKIFIRESASSKILITGGGAKNGYLIKRLKFHLKDKLEILVPDNKMIDYKEALAFAFLGVRRLRGEVNVLKSVTGAKSDSSSGVLVGFLA